MPLVRLPSLRVRIMVSAAVAVAVLLLSLGGVATRILHHQAEDVMRERLRVAELAASRLDAALAADLGRLRALAGTEPVRPQAVQIFNLGILRLDQDGRVLWYSPGRSGGDAPALAGTLVGTQAFQTALRAGRTAWTDLTRTPAGQPVVAVLEPVPGAGGRPAGVLAGVIDLGARGLEPFLAGTLPGGNTAHVVLVDGDGWVLASTGPIPPYTRDEHPEFFSALIRSGMPQIGRTDDGAGDTLPHVMAAAPLRVAPWAVSVGQAEREAMAPVSRLRWLLILFGAAAVLLAILYSWWDTGAVIEPLARLTRAAQEVARGNLDEPVRVERRDEIGTLGEAFETMRLRLREAREELQRALEEAKRREQEAAALYRVGSEILSSLDLETILQTVVDQARTLLGAEVAVLCLEEDGSLRVAAASDPGGRLQTEGAVETARRPDTALCAGCPAPAVAWLPQRASATLSAGNRTIGFLCAGGQNPVGPVESRLLAGLANQAAIAIENARLYENVKTLAVYEERDRIAREMHDSVAQSLGYMYSRLRLLQDRYPQDREPALWADLDDLARVASASYDEVRWAIFGLRTGHPHRAGLLSALAGYVRDFTTRTGVRAELAGETLGRVALAPEAEAQLVRIVQEALTNVAKHAAATQVWVRVEARGDSVHVVVEDNGVGFEPGAKAGQDGHYGLATMRERAESVGGHLEIDTAPGAGCRVHIAMPLVH